MGKEQIFVENSLDIYQVDHHKIGKASGLWQIMQEAGNVQMTIQRPSYAEMVARGQALMLSRSDLKILEPIRLEEPLRVSSWPCPSSRATFLRNYGIWKGDKLAAIASTYWTMVDMNSRKILKVEDLDTSNYWMDDFTELIPAKFKIDKAELETMETVGHKDVQYSDLDYNGHMNNTYYMDVLSNYVPELAAGTHRACFLRVHFSKEAPLGDRLAVKRTPPLPVSPEEQVVYGPTSDVKYRFRTEKADGEMNIQAELVLCPVE